MERNFAAADLMNFEKLIAPKVIKVVYWIGLVGISLFALTTFFGALAMLQYSPVAALGSMLVAVVGLAFAILFWRVMIEVYIVFFGIYDRLGDIRDGLERKPDTSIP